MQYVRKFDVDALDRGRFDYQVLADLETCLVVACRAPAGRPGPHGMCTAATRSTMCWLGR